MPKFALIHPPTNGDKIPNYERTHHIDTGENKEGCDDDDGERSEEANDEEEEVVAEVVPIVPGRAAAGNDTIR